MAQNIAAEDAHIPILLSFPNARTLATSPRPVRTCPSRTWGAGRNTYKARQNPSVFGPGAMLPDDRSCSPASPNLI